MALCIAGLFTRNTSALAPLPTADEIIALHVKARGGLDVWRKLTSIRRVFEIDGLTVAGLWAGDRAWLDQFSEGRTELSATDGKSGWTRWSYDGSGTRDLGVAEVNDVRERAAMGLELFLVKELGLRVTVAGQETFNRAPVIRLSIDTPAGQRLSLLLEAKTYLEVARARNVNGPDGAEEMVTEMRDYRAEGGILMAHQIGSGYVTYTINETIDPAWFAKPR